MSATQKVKTFVAYYWLGGTLNGTWIVIRGLNAETCKGTVETIHRGGRVCHYVEESKFHGVPDDAPSLDQLKNAIRLARFYTPNEEDTGVNR